VLSPEILLLSARHMNHSADLPLTTGERHQRAQQTYDIEPIGLGTPGAPIHQEARCVEDRILDPMFAKQAVQPEAIVTSLIAGDDANRLAELGLSSGARLVDQPE